MLRRPLVRRFVQPACVCLVAHATNRTNTLNIDSHRCCNATYTAARNDADYACTGHAPLFSSGHIGFALDAAPTLEHAVGSGRHEAGVEDAFADDGDGGDSGASRRRANAYSADRLKQRRAQVMLDLGPDAVLMDFPEGHVPRQGQ
jgi:hypothetical protein